MKAKVFAPLALVAALLAHVRMKATPATTTS